MNLHNYHGNIIGASRVYKIISDKWNSAEFCYACIVACHKLGNAVWLIPPITGAQLNSETEEACA